VISRLLPSLRDVQHLGTWVGIVAGVAAVLGLAFLILNAVENSLQKIYDERVR